MKKTIGHKEDELDNKPYELETDNFGFPKIQEVTVSANVAPPQLVTPLGMMRSGHSEPIVDKKKKKQAKP